jgi:hypothetical protein
MMLLQVENHIKWSFNKLDAFMIFNRSSEHKTSLITSTAGKEAWKILTRNGFETSPLPQDQLLRELHELFDGSVSFATLEQDMEQFLDSLSREGIIKRAEVN